MPWCKHILFRMWAETEHTYFFYGHKMIDKLTNEIVIKHNVKQNMAQRAVKKYINAIKAEVANSIANVYFDSETYSVSLNKIKTKSGQIRIPGIIYITN